MSSTLKQLKVQYKAARAAYALGNDIMTDADFDALEAEIRRLDPEWAGLKVRSQKVKLGKKEEVKLFRPMPSLNKIKAEVAGSFQKWLDRVGATDQDEIYVSAKYDGLSVELTYDKTGRAVKLVTCGDGVTGKDITYLLPSFPFPKLPVSNHGLRIFRCEAIMNNKTFAEKYSSGFKTSRAMAAGLLNRQDAHPALADLSFVVLDTFAGYPPEDMVTHWTRREAFKRDISATLNRQRTPLNLLLPLGVRWTIGKGTPLTNEALSSVLRNCRGSSFDMDGVVVVLLGRKEEPSIENPKYAVAFKDNDQSEQHETTIEEVIWQTSRTGKLVPKARVQPVKFNGTTVTFCALYNLQQCIDNGWGVGAKVLLRRSGDIIPEIIKTIEPKKFTKADHPNPSAVGEYVKKGVDFVLVNKLENKEVLEKRLLQTVRCLGMEHLALKSIRLLVEAGDESLSPGAFLKAVLHHPEKFLTACENAGVSLVVAKKALASMPKTHSLADLMLATGECADSVGHRQLEVALALTAHGLVLGPVKDMSRVAQKPLLSEVCTRAMGNILGPRAAQSIRNSLMLLNIFQIEPQDFTPTPVAAVKVMSTKLRGQSVSFTGYRSEDHEKAIVANGGKVVPFGTKTTILLVKAGGKTSGKVAKAEDAGIRVCSFDQLSI